MSTPPDATLAALRQEFPGYRVWLEPACGRYRFVARRLHPGTRPHTVITSDPAELRAALAVAAPPRPAIPPSAADRLALWREAWQIRRAHPKWAVLWVAFAQQYQAFRLSRRHRDAIITAATPDHLAAQIEQAEQADQARRPRRTR